LSLHFDQENGHASLDLLKKRDFLVPKATASEKEIKQHRIRGFGNLICDLIQYEEKQIMQFRK
jgi:hypothetical protein